MLPAAVPSMFNGIRLGVMYTLVAVVAIEYLTDFGGLGRVVSDEYFRYRIPGTYAGICSWCWSACCSIGHSEGSSDG